jgi:acyl-coenzyme A synthetase/AMP-(fatty) acid ligase
MTVATLTRYHEVYARWQAAPEAFWAEAAEAVDWYQRWDRVLDDSRPPFYRWFPGGLVNTCHNAVDRHADGGRGDQPALIYDSPVTSTVRTLTNRPPGCLPTLWNNEAGYRDQYLETYPGWYLTADAGFKDEDGYLWIMSRTDDVINVAGHRLSTGSMEEVLASHPDVAECAVVGVADEIKGEVPLGLVVLKAGHPRAGADIATELVALVRERIGPVASFKLAMLVRRLPKTRSGKIVRGTIKKIADGVPYRVPPTIDDPAILEEITADLAAIGFPRQRETQA